MKPNTLMLEDIKVNIKIKLASLWTALMFCYIYGDFFTLFVPGRIKGLMEGRSGAGTTTPVMLLMYAVMLSLPALMIFLSVLLKPKANRLLNIILGIFFTVIMLLVVSASIDKWMIFYIYLGVIEVVISLLIVVNAWRWPRQV